MGDGDGAGGAARAPDGRPDRARPATACSRRAALAGGGAFALGLAGCLGGATPPGERAIEATGGLAAFEDVAAALEAGYRSRSAYVTDDAGVLGVPFVDVEQDAVDPERPRALFYHLDDEGRYTLLGGEWYVPTAEADRPPSLFGREFDGPDPGGFPGQPEHYGLHGWVASENPEGTFATHNPAVQPPAFAERVASARDALREFTSFRGGSTRAIEAGYRNTESWTVTPDGAYGVPFVRPDRAGDLDPSAPPVLLYRMTSSWYYELLGAEWYVPTSARKDPPTMFGQEFHDVVGGHSDATEQGRHYGLHAWLFRANPAGLFAPFNPALAEGGGEA